MAPKKHNNSLPKSNQQIPTSQSQDMFETLLESHIYSSPTGSSSNPQHSMGFAHYASQQPPFNPYSLPPHFHNSPYYPNFQTPIQTPESDTEEVEETQPEPKGKKVVCKKVAWTDLESKILAERWVHVSENPATGNSQSRDSFWGEVRRQYNSLVSEKRRADQITGKWSKMSKDVKQFIGIYSKLEEHWQSGAGGEDIMLHARKIFKQQTKRAFAYEEAWRVLKDCPKFLAHEGVMSSSKRARPIDDLFQQDSIDLDDDNPNPAHVPNPAQFESLFRDDAIRRPPGRSKSQKSSGSSDAASRLSKEEAREKVVITAEAAAEATTRTMEKLAMDSETRTMFKGLKLLSKPVSRDLPPDEYQMIMKAREKIKKKYAKHFEDSDEEE